MKKKKLTVKKIIEPKEIVSCYDCAYEVGGVCIKRLHAAGIPCEFFTKGKKTKKELDRILAEMYYELKEEVEDKKQKLEILRQVVIKHFGEGSHLAGKYIVNIDKYERRLIDLEKVKGLIKGKEDEFTRISETTYVRVKKIEG